MTSHPDVQWAKNVTDTRQTTMKTDVWMTVVVWTKYCTSISSDVKVCQKFTLELDVSIDIVMKQNISVQEEEDLDHQQWDTDTK